jgi:hypothetical protein
MATDERPRVVVTTTPHRCGKSVLAPTMAGSRISGVWLDEISDWAAKMTGNSPQVRGMLADGVTQLVQVTSLRELDRKVLERKTYAYAWAGDPLLKIGDVVMCPPGSSSRGAWMAVVTEFGSDYDGVHRSIIRRATEFDIAKQAALDAKKTGHGGPT